MEQQEVELLDRALRQAEVTFLRLNGWLPVSGHPLLWYPSQRIGDIYPREEYAVGIATAIQAQREMNFELFSQPVEG